MRTVVSQATMLIDGVPACPRCGRRPRKPIPETAVRTRKSGRRWYGYCAVCLPEAEWERRQNAIKLTAEERELILALRKESCRPAGKHHAG